MRAGSRPTVESKRDLESVRLKQYIQKGSAVYSDGAKSFRNMALANGMTHSAVRHILCEFVGPRVSKGKRAGTLLIDRLCLKRLTPSEGVQQS